MGVVGITGVPSWAKTMDVGANAMATKLLRMAVIIFMVREEE